jgi:ketosteroid isomerase-like protein
MSGERKIIYDTNGSRWPHHQETARKASDKFAPRKIEKHYFAPEMIAITPTDRLRLEGQKACIAGWTDFVRTTKILRWLESNPLTLVLAEGRAAVVAYDFQIDFEAGGRVVHMSGRDLMTLEKRDGHWWLVADHFSPSPGWDRGSRPFSLTSTA